MIRTLLAALLALVLAGPALAERVVRILPADHGFDAVTVTAKVNSKLAWIGRETDYNVEMIDYVELIVVSPQTIHEITMNSQGLAAQIGGAIFIRDDFRLQIDGAILLHELVHIVQYHNDAFPGRGQNVNCQKELEAYRLQTKWATSNGGLIPGAMWMLMLTSCAKGADW